MEKRQVDVDVIKVMVGKSVPKAMLTYMTDINIKEEFQKLQTMTRINGELIKPESENQLVALGKTVADMQERIIILNDTIAELEGRLSERDNEIADLEFKLKEATEETSRRFSRIERILIAKGILEKEES